MHDPFNVLRNTNQYTSMHIAIQKMIVFFSVQYYVFLIISTPSPLSLYFFLLSMKLCLCKTTHFSVVAFFLYLLFIIVTFCDHLWYILSNLFFSNQIFEDMRWIFFFLVFALNLVNVNCKRLFMWIIYVYWSVNCDSYVDKHGNCDRAGSVN